MLDIQRKLVKYNFSARSIKPTHIVIHDTGNPGASALNHYNYFNGGNRNASADYFVDSNNIIQN
jgi:N-acetylmuramoyl-L-alanine amidase